MALVEENLFFSIVVVSSRANPEKLAPCLSALFQNTYPADSFEIIVVDSGSGPAVLNYLRHLERDHPNLKVILPGRGNIGPARGRNLGIKAARGAIVAFTDDDVIVAVDWLFQLADGYQRHPDAAGVGGITLPPQNCLEKNLWAQYESFLYLNLLQRPQGEYFSYERDELPAYAGSISYRKEVLEKVGGFNENFPPLIYGEDGDLKERVLHLGYRLLYVPVVNYHLADYHWRSFWRKEEKRGAGILFYRKLHGLKIYPRVVEALKMLFFPLVFLHKLRVSRNLRFSLMAALAFFARQVGKLRYYDQI